MDTMVQGYRYIERLGLIRYLKAIPSTLCLILVCSCSDKGTGEREYPGVETTETRGSMEIVVTGKSGLQEDRMGSVRFIVFKDASTNPVMELNEFFEIASTGSGDGEVSGFRVVLEVGRRVNRPGDKMVVAIVNEPAALRSVLDRVGSYDQLRNVKLDFAHFITADHSRLADGRDMPMTGVAWTDKVYATVGEAGADPVKMEVRRAVARIDVYLKKETALDAGLAAGTQVVLNRTFDKEYLVHHTEGANSFGRIGTVTSGLISKRLVLEGSFDPDLPPVSLGGNGRLLFSFYTPERTCMAAGDSDKLQLRIEVVTDEGAIRTGELVVDKFLLGGVETDIDVISRNNIYKVIITVGMNTLTSKILDWNEEDIYVEF